MPAEGTTQISRPLSDLSLAYSNPASIAEGVFPRKTVMVQKGKIYILKPENLRKVDTGPRAYGEPAARSHWVSEPIDFALDHHSLFDAIDVNQKAYGMDQPLNPKKAMTLTLTGQLMISKEHDAVDKCFKTSAFNTGYHATPTTKWDATGGDPIGEINDASQKVLLGCGMAGQRGGYRLRRVDQAHLAGAYRQPVQVCADRHDHRGDVRYAVPVAGRG